MLNGKRGWRILVERVARGSDELQLLLCNTFFGGFASKPPISRFRLCLSPTPWFSTPNGIGFSMLTNVRRFASSVFTVQRCCVLSGKIQLSKMLVETQICGMCFVLCRKTRCCFFFRCIHSPGCESQENMLERCICAGPHLLSSTALESQHFLTTAR